MMSPRTDSSVAWPLQENLLQQLGADDFPNLCALIGNLLSRALATQNLVTQSFPFCGQTVHGGMVLVLDGQTNVPILRTVLGFLEEVLVVHNRPLALLLLKERLGRLAQAGEVGIHFGGVHANQRYAPDRTFGVVLLS